MIDRNLSYFVYKKQILKEDECLQFIKWCEENKNFESSKIENSEINNLIRKSQTLRLPEDCPYVDLILKKLNEAFLEYCEEYLEDSYFISMQESTRNGYIFEPLQYVKYDNDDFYQWHTDQGTDTKSICRLISFILYLNNDFVGGETEFVFDKYKPNVGEVLIFPSNFLFPHCGKKIINGNKKIITTWLNNLGVVDGNH